MTENLTGHGGHHVAEALRVNGVDRVFTLSGGHIFPIYDGLRERGMKIIDVRHEQTAGFAAEGHAKLSRQLGVCALTAGPGVTNGMSPLTGAFFNGSPLMMLGGRAPRSRWGQGSLQEMDHLPLVRDITKFAETVMDTSLLAKTTSQAIAAATSPHRGPVFIDVPMDVIFNLAEVEAPMANGDRAEAAIVGDLDVALRVLAESERPAILIGSDVWANGAEDAMRKLVETQKIPTFANGMGRGVIPADHSLGFSASRGYAFRTADLVIVVGTPLDFRVGFGVFGAAKVIHIVDHESQLASHISLAAGLSGRALGSILEGLAEAAPKGRDAWVADLRRVEGEQRQKNAADLTNPNMPIHPARVYGEVVPRLARDGVVICDGGDFVSYAGKFVEVFEPGGWLDPGPYGCLGTGPGYALAAGMLEPDRQTVLLLGDGAAGFGMGDWDTLVRFGINVTIVCGNNGIWGLEKHPMQMIYGYDVAAELRPETRYDEVMSALGGHGELVRTSDELGPALDRALATPGPSLVNVITDPAVAYPRTANLS